MYVSLSNCIHAGIIMGLIWMLIHYEYLNKPNQNWSLFIYSNVIGLMLIFIPILINDFFNKN